MSTPPPASTQDPTPPWLSDTERDAFLALMSVVMRLETTLDAQLRADAGLSHFEYTVLARLSESPHRERRMSELAWFAEGSLPRLSQSVARLEKQGLVERYPDPSDGRYTIAHLTQAGWAKVVDAAPGHVTEVRNLVFDRLTKNQVTQMTKICQRIAAAIDPADRCLSE